MSETLLNEKIMNEVNLKLEWKGFPCNDSNKDKHEARACSIKYSYMDCWADLIQITNLLILLPPVQMI